MPATVSSHKQDAFIFPQSTLLTATEESMSSYMELQAPPMRITTPSYSPRTEKTAIIGIKCPLSPVYSPESRAPIQFTLTILTPFP